VLEPDSFNLAGFVPCRLVRVGVDLPEPFARVTLLPDDTSLMEFEIPISIEQARQLALIVAKERAPRPMTAELMQDVLASYGFNVSYVALDEVVGGNVHAVLAISGQDGRTRLFSARPSDAIMLALLQPVQAPIMVAPQLVGQRGAEKGQADEFVGSMSADNNDFQDPTPPQVDSPVLDAEAEIVNGAGAPSHAGED